MKLRNRHSKITLGVLALGVFVSCSSKSPEDAYPVDRAVGGPSIRVANQDPAWLSSHPDSSGWRISWGLPASRDGILEIYVFGDSIGKDREGRLTNGTEGLDESGLPKILARLSPTDTSWSIPSSVFGGAQGMRLRTDSVYRISVWVRYQSGPAGQPRWDELYLGDESPPILPLIVDSIGQTSAVLRFARPKDVASRFDSTFSGVIRSIRATWWEGAAPSDSGGNTHSVSVPESELSDAANDTFRLVLAPLRHWTRYCYVMRIEDTSGMVRISEIYQFTTHDSLAPAGASSLARTKAGADSARTDSVSFSWLPATDTAGRDGVPLRSARPNYHIRRYVVVLDGAGVDSVDLSPSDSAQLGAGQGWSPAVEPARFSWDGSKWNWYWRDLRPGKPWTVQVRAYDWSGNPASQIPSLRDSVRLPDGFAGRCEAGWVPVGGDGSRAMSDYCIEEHEHSSAGKVVTRVTWSEAKQACSDIGAQLCSDAQWEWACMSLPGGTGRLLPYGAVSAGEGGVDTFTWLQTHCQLGTGDSTAFRSVSNTDPRCVSGWGVFDMPGRVGEWTRDVYRTDNQDTSNLEAGTLAYLGPSDLPNTPEIGTIHGGSALVLDQSDRTLASARCRTRNYPASSVVDTIRDSSGNLISKIQHPLPTGTSSAWGFRCCKRFP